MDSLVISIMDRSVAFVKEVALKSWLFFTPARHKGISEVPAIDRRDIAKLRPSIGQLRFISPSMVGR